MRTDDAVPKTLMLSRQDLAELEELARQERENPPYYYGITWADLVRRAVGDFIAKAAEKKAEKKIRKVRRG